MYFYDNMLHEKRNLIGIRERFLKEFYKILIFNHVLCIKMACNRIIKNINTFEIVSVRIDTVSNVLTLLYIYQICGEL